MREGFSYEGKGDERGKWTLTVLALAGVALDHLVSCLEARVGHLGDGVLFVGCLGGGDDGGVGGEGEVDTGVGDQVGLELVQVNVEGAVESEGCSDA